MIVSNNWKWTNPFHTQLLDDDKSLLTSLTLIVRCLTVQHSLSPSYTHIPLLSYPTTQKTQYCMFGISYFILYRYQGDMLCIKIVSGQIGLRSMALDMNMERLYVTLHWLRARLSRFVYVLTGVYVFIYTIE